MVQIIVMLQRVVQIIFMTQEVKSCTKRHMLPFRTKFQLRAHFVALHFILLVSVVIYNINDLTGLSVLGSERPKARSRKH